MAQPLSKSPMHTLCVGRYLIDVPEDYVLDRHDYLIHSVQYAAMSRDIGDETVFRQKLSEREAELRQKKNGYGLPSLEGSEPLGNAPYPRHIFRFDRTKPSYHTEFGRRVEDTEEGLSVEIWLWFKTYGFKVYGEYLKIDNVAEASLRARSLRPLAMDEIPTGPGYCMETSRGRIFLPEASRPDRGEITQIQLSLKSAPDIRFGMVHYTNGDKLREPYLARAGRTGRLMGLIYPFLHVSILRSGDRVVNGMPGQELIQASYKKSFPTHLMKWQTSGKINDPLYPEINFEGSAGFTTAEGGVINPSVSDAELLVLWDSIVDSIRLRPTQTAAADGRP